MNKEFDRFAESFAFWAETANPKQYDALLADLIPARIGRALDVGCGPGVLSVWLASRSDQVIGIDISPAMVRIAHRRAAEAAAANVAFVVGNAEGPPFPKETFDLVASDATIHDTNLERSLPAICSLVRPGGCAIVRDVITRNPARARSRLWQLLGTLRNVPGYLRRLGFITTARVLRFEASPTWLRHRAQGSELTPAEFRRVLGSYLEGCSFRREPWFMTAVWRRRE